MSTSAVNSASTVAASSATATASAENPSGILGKDDFLQLLLTQLQYQDPTEPTDSEKILTQTSQLASLESAQNTNDALESLSSALQSTQEFSIVSSIGKRADLGSDAISHEAGSETSFEVYFPEDIKSGTVEITDLEDNVIATIPIEIPEGEESKSAGVYQFTWDGVTNRGDGADSGIYRVNSDYTDSDGTAQQTRLGAYPIESVRFEDGKAYLKLGSNYVPLEDIVEVY